MDYLNEAEIIKSKINTDVEFEVWYFNKDRFIIKSLTTENPKLKKEDIIRDFTSDRIESFYINDKKVYSFNYIGDSHILVAFYKDIELAEDIKLELFWYLGGLYINQVLTSSNEERHIILDIVKSMSQPLELKDILDNILKGAVKILSKARLGYIQLYNEDKEILEVAASVGFEKSIFEFKPSVGESVTGKVFLDGNPRFYNTRDEIEKDSETWDLTNRNLNIVEELFVKQKLGGLICVPITYKDKKLGVMTLHKLATDEIEFSEYDVKFLESFASKAAISIENAKLINRLKESIDETERINRYISKKNQIYKDLTQLSLMNRGLLEISRALSIHLDTPLMLYENSKNKLAFNNLDEKLSEADVIKLISDYEHEDIGLSDTVYEDYYFFPIKNGNVLLGYIITNKNICLDDEKKDLINESALTLTIELMKAYVLEDIVFKRTHEYFTNLINSTDKMEIEEYRKKLNLPSESNFLSIIIGIEDYKDLQLLQMDTHNLIAIIANEFKDYDNLLYAFHNKINLILYSDKKEDLEKIKFKLEHVAKLEKQLNNTGISIGIGSYYPRIENIVKSYREADLALSYIIRRKDKFVISYDEIGINRLFINHIPGDIDKFLDDTLKELRTEESEKSDLEETLFTYIQTNKSAVETSERLHIHINTFYNRLKKIEKLLDIDFDNPEDNLKIQLACYLNKNKENIIM